MIFQHQFFFNFVFVPARKTSSLMDLHLNDGCELFIWNGKQVYMFVDDVSDIYSTFKAQRVEQWFNSHPSGLGGF